MPEDYLSQKLQIVVVTVGAMGRNKIGENSPGSGTNPIFGIPFLGHPREEAAFSGQ